MIPGGASYKTLDKIGYLEQVANDPAQPAELRVPVAAELERIDAGAPVHPIYKRSAPLQSLRRRTGRRTCISSPPMPWPAPKTPTEPAHPGPEP